MGYNDINNRQDDRPDMDRGRNLNVGNMGNDMPDMRMNMNSGMMKQGKQRMGGAMKQDTKQIEEAYSMIDERMCQAIAFHEQLADYFCFLGLQGFKRMCEYQYMKEVAEKRKMHRRYIDAHNKILPVCSCQAMSIIPQEWSRYTTEDIDDNVIPKYVKMALKQYYDWERETKEYYTEICEQLKQTRGATADEEYIKELILAAEKECKKIMRIYERLNGVGYDVTAIHGMQDKYHEKYKKKYNEHFTNRTRRYIRPRNEWDIENMDEEYRRTRIGY